MDINNNQQVNTFVKGMDTDTSDMYIGEGQYRYAENLRVVTDGDSNSGELHIIEGTTKLVNRNENEQLLGFTSIRKYAIEIIKNGDSWSIYRTTVIPDQTGTEDRVLIAGPFAERIWPEGWKGETKPLSLVTRWESDDTVKLYIADGIHTLMSINIMNENQGTDFDQIFQDTSEMLEAPKIKVLDEVGANIPGVVVQYGYCIYKRRGQVSSLSVLSKSASIGINNVDGYLLDQNAYRVVRVTLPTNILGKDVRVYRVCYSRSGQLPRVDVIYDQKCSSVDIRDVGQSLLNVSTAEFIATNKLVFVPNIIESKGDYLFAANVQYTQDDIDSQFSNFDARCFSSGSYYVKNLQQKIIGNNATDEYLLQVPEDGISHKQFDSAEKEFDPQQWRVNKSGFNGHGLCFDWKYTYNTNTLYIKEQYGENYTSAPRTYARNEVYRFGVKLYDKDGRASSVKWIADIKMPDYFNPTGDASMKDYIYSYDDSNDHQTEVSQITQNRDEKIEQLNIYKEAEKNRIQANEELTEEEKQAQIEYLEQSISQQIEDAQKEASSQINQLSRPQWKVNNISIKFVPRNIDTYWKNVSRYEIVQAKRGIEDSYKIAQGIVGYPMDSQDNSLSLPYYLTTQDFYVHRAIVTNAIPSGFDTTWGFWPYDADGIHLFDKLYSYKQSKEQLIFISPEYTYQPDDIKTLLSRYKTGIFYKTVNWLGSKSDVYAKHNTISVAHSAFTKSWNGTSGTDRWIYFKNLEDTEDKVDLTCGIYYSGSSADEYDGTYYLSHNIRDQVNHGRELEPLGGTKWDGSSHTRKSVCLTYDAPDKIIAKEQNIQLVNNSLPINDVSYYEAENPENIAKDEKPYWRNHFVTLKNGKKFFNWNNPVLVQESWYNLVRNDDGEIIINGWKSQTMDSYEDPWMASNKYEYPMSSRTEINSWGDQRIMQGVMGLMYPMSPGGPGIILETGQYTKDYFNKNVPYSGGSSAYTPPVTIGNIYKSATPYGGYSISAINSTQYVGEGYVSSPEDTDGIVVSMGDNRITIFVYFLYHNFDNAQHDLLDTAAMQYVVPIESTMDLTNQASKYLQVTHAESLPIKGSDDGFWISAKPSTNGGRFSQTSDLYLYNTAYSITPDIITYSAQDTINAADSIYDSRIHYSQKKQNNELIDNWTNFKAIDYLDVDSRCGTITGLKLFKDKLVFLQENGAGILSVNDRTILKDQSSANIIIGNGGVLDRYDYFTTIYGMKPDQHAVEASNDSLYWWDGYRKEMISYTDGYNVNLIQRIKNVQNYIDSYGESKTPSIIYDVDNKEVLFNVVNDESIVYNEQVQQFTSIYKFAPIYYCNLNGIMVVTNSWKNGDAGLYKYNDAHSQSVTLFDHSVYPMVRYVVNKDSIYNKVFDIQTFGGRFYKGDKSHLKFDYYTPLKQHSHTDGNSVTDIEYDFRLAIPRNNGDAYGGRMRGKTMQCQIESNSNDIDFSLQYVTTKYRMSWS